MCESVRAFVCLCLCTLWSSSLACNFTCVNKVCVCLCVYAIAHCGAHPGRAIKNNFCVGVCWDCSSGSLCVFFFSAVYECVFVFECIFCVLSSCFGLCLRTMCLRLPHIVFDDSHGAIWRQWKYEEGAHARELCAMRMCIVSFFRCTVNCALRCALCHSLDDCNINLQRLHLLTQMLLQCTMGLCI